MHRPENGPPEARGKAERPRFTRAMALTFQRLKFEAVPKHQFLEQLPWIYMEKPDF
jgi:hypothetical protein